MAERVQQIVDQIGNIRQLQTIVTAMRGIAAARAQAGRTLLAAIAEYSEVVSVAIGRALNLQKSDMTRRASPSLATRARIMVCAEQGFAGSLTERVMEKADLASTSNTINLVLGSRGITLFAEQRIAVTWSAAMATRIDAIPGLANRLAAAVYDAVSRSGAAAVDVIHGKSSGSLLEVVQSSVLPIDFAKLSVPTENEPPLHTLSPDVLLDRLAAEYVFAQLCAAITYAFEAENTARMIAMASAKSNIEGKLETLGRTERQLRQQETTSEILELAAGAAALAESR